MAQPSDHRPFTHRVPAGAGVMPLVPSAHMSRGGAAYRGTGRADTVAGDVADGLAIGRSDVQEAGNSAITTSTSEVRRPPHLLIHRVSGGGPALDRHIRLLIHRRALGNPTCQESSGTE